MYIQSDPDYYCINYQVILLYSIGENLKQNHPKQQNAS